MTTINAMATGMSHPHSPLGHGAFDLDHLAGPIRVTYRSGPVPTVDDQ